MIRAASAGVLAAGLAGVGLGYRLLLSETSQTLGPFPYRGSDVRRVVALTFDNGPNDPYTGALAEVLAARQVPATFFQVGRCVERHPRRTAELAAAGHLIGNHSYRHRADDYARPGTFLAGVDRTQQIIADLTGLEPRYVRPPWLYRTPTVLAGLQRRGLRVVSGRFGHPLEIFQPPAARIARAAAMTVAPGGIMILHNGFDDRSGFRGRTVRATALLIDELRDRGYDFVTVETLIR